MIFVFHFLLFEGVAVAITPALLSVVKIKTSDFTDLTDAACATNTKENPCNQCNPLTKK